MALSFSSWVSTSEYFNNKNPRFVRFMIEPANCRVSEPEPVFLPGSGSGFKISLDPDPVSVPGSGSLAQKCKETAQKVIY